MRTRARGLGVIGVAALGAVSVLIALGLSSSHPAESANVSLASASSQVADWETTTTTTVPPPPPTTAAPAPAPAPHVTRPRAARSAPQRVVTGGGGNGFMACVRQHESGGNYATNTGNGYHGAYQMTNSHWGGYGGYSSAEQAPPEVQDAKFADDMSHGSGYMHQQYPTTSRMCGG